LIKTFARTKDLQLLSDVPVERLFKDDILWYWVDFDTPDEAQAAVLSSQFNFNHLAVEDCLDFCERPKVDYYDQYNFFIFNSLDPDTFEPIEIDIFAGENYLVTFHQTSLKEIDSVRQKLLETANTKNEETSYYVYQILDKIVDSYFPAVYKTEDALSDIDIRLGNRDTEGMIEQLFAIRTDLLKLRRIVSSMKELLYRILNSEHLANFGIKKRYYNDIYDHLLKLSDIIETNREITTDVRDNIISVNSNKMNTIMTILTVISSIFIPLTFIVGVYGMNFKFMPELGWRYGYYIIMGLMAVICVFMVVYFIRKGWLTISKKSRKKK